MMNRIRGMFQVFLEFLRREGRHIVLFFGMLSIGAIMFEVGFIQGTRRVPSPVIIEKPAMAADVCATGPDGRNTDIPGTENRGGAAPSSVTADPPVTGACRFVGSRNSTLYHLPTCAAAKRIKPENRVCFTSEEDAGARGYRPGCLKK